VLEHESAARVPPTHGQPAVPFGPEALQILTAEHWSLLAARSLVYTEAMSRATMFVAALSASVVALAFVAQATDFGSGFHAFALVLLPVVYLLGVSTIARLSQVNLEDATWVAGMNRIRHAYLELAPELEPYFVTSRFDDEAGIRLTSLARRRPFSPAQPFIAIPGLVAVLDSVVGGAAVGIAGLALDLDVAGSIVLGCVGFLVSALAFFAWAQRAIRSEVERWRPAFPTPPDARPTR
jgi:hypothetical protein